MTHHAVIEALEESVEKLNKDLHIMRNLLMLEGKTMITAHDNVRILVFAPSTYKAYVPKKYDGFTVEFSDWYGTIEPIDMNTLIKLEKHGIYLS